MTSRPSSSPVTGRDAAPTSRPPPDPYVDLFRARNSLSRIRTSTPSSAGHAGPLVTNPAKHSILQAAHVGYALMPALPATFSSAALARARADSYKRIHVSAAVVRSAYD